ncbi:MAG: AAA family ATPase [Sulfurovum sp.]|nr:AAA family ATPase [Sulfurovum sp.]MDD3499764.1 AAA family ATPase [Sulfurovum sp.]
MNLPILQKISAQILSKEVPSYKRWLYEKIDFSANLIGIKGPRGAGKSTILQQYAKASDIEPSKILYVSCDHPAMAGVSLYDIGENFYARGGKLFIVDEIHKNENFSQELKALYDVFDMQIVFSGSSALKIEHASADLSRRAVVHDLGVLSLREFVEIQTGQKFQSFTLEDITSKHYDIATTIMGRIRPLEQFEDYINYGCYPFYQESLTDYPQKLLEVINLTIDSDLCGIYNIDPSKLDKLKKIIYMLCATSPYELNVSKLSAAVGTSWPTLSKYLERMDAGSLIHIVRGGSGMRAVNKPDKLLLDNPNLFTVLCANPDIGSIRESFFVSQVSLGYQVHYHDRGDFIVDETKVFEIGGASKKEEQLQGNKNGYIASDNIEIGYDNKIPLWLFGFLY